MRNISEQDEIEKELSKWKRRWTLEEMRERTMDSMDPCPEHFQVQEYSSYIFFRSTY